MRRTVHPRLSDSSNMFLRTGQCKHCTSYLPCGNMPPQTTDWWTDFTEIMELQVESNLCSRNCSGITRPPRFILPRPVAWSNRSNRVFAKLNILLRVTSKRDTLPQHRVNASTASVSQRNTLTASRTTPSLNMHAKCPTWQKPPPNMYRHRQNRSSTFQPPP